MTRIPIVEHLPPDEIAGGTAPARTRPRRPAGTCWGGSPDRTSRSSCGARTRRGAAGSRWRGGRGRCGAPARRATGGTSARRCRCSAPTRRPGGTACGGPRRRTRGGWGKRWPSSPGGPTRTGAEVLVVVIDKAGYHTAKKLAGPANVRLHAGVAAGRAAVAGAAGGGGEPRVRRPADPVRHHHDPPSVDGRITRRSSAE